MIAGFFEYVRGFYGVGGIYDMNVEDRMIDAAIQIRLQNNDFPFEGDTVDREMVREILIGLQAA